MAMLRMTFVVVAAVSLAAGARAERLRDCLWISGDETGHLDGPGNKWGLPPATEYYHQVRGCIDFGIASLHCGMFGHPDKALRDSFAGLDRVTFTASTNKEDPTFHHRLVDDTIEISKTMTNLVGMVFDDFFRTWSKAAFTLDELKDIRRRVKALERPLEMQVVTYDFMYRQDPNLGKSPEEMVPFLEQFDKIRLWLWETKDVRRLPEALAVLRRLAKGKKILFGIYMWDFGMKREASAEDVKFELDFALEKWKSGEIDEVAFFPTSICNRDFAAVKLARDWTWRNMACERKSK